MEIAKRKSGDKGKEAAESLGAGQVILFASSPGFRAYFKGTGRLLANAIVYGPSLGASQPHIW